MSARSSTQILGCRIDRVSWQEIDSFCHQALEGKQAQQIVTVNGEIILLANSNPEYQRVINNAELVIPDSTNVIWVSWLKGSALKQRTPGSDLTVRLAEIAAKKGASIYLLGSWNGAAKESANYLTRRFPQLKIAGWSEQNPDEFNPEEIARSGANIVLVAYGAPKQEFWINKNKEQTGAQILVGVGGTFDMLSGKLPRAPKIFRLLYLEWLWRLILQPSRFGRIWRAVVVFPLKALTN